MNEAGAGANTLSAWLLVAGTLAALPAMAADDDARAWLAGMTEAVATRTYQGEFLHMANGHFEKLQILHRVKDGHVAERLVSLSGSGREIVRTDGEVQCYLPDEHKVLVETHAEHGPLLGTLPTFGDNLEANYRLEIAGRVRSVIGRNARILAVTPRDGFRFGYRVWIDEGTHMPVRTDLCDLQGNVLEQVLFTSLRVGGVLADAAFKPSLQTDNYTWVRQGSSGALASASLLPWRLMRMPPGFRISSSGLELLPGSERPVTHLVVSDGLASVSVFIEGPSAPHLATDGTGRVGSAYAYSKVVGGLQITAVGEVPPETVQLIASGVSAASPPKVGFGGSAPVSSPQ
jgi:sigma-E factor negative regulatory protein RseB